MSYQAITTGMGLRGALASGGTCPPAKQSGSGQRLAVRVPRQVILLLQLWVAGSAGVIYKAFSDASKVGLLVFLELSLERIP